MSSDSHCVQNLLNQLFGLEDDLLLKPNDVLNYYLKQVKTNPISNVFINEALLPFFQTPEGEISK